MCLTGDCRNANSTFHALFHKRSRANCTSKKVCWGLNCAQTLHESISHHWYLQRKNVCLCVLWHFLCACLHRVCSNILCLQTHNTETLLANCFLFCVSIKLLGESGSLFFPPQMAHNPPTCCLLRNVTLWVVGPAPSTPQIHHLASSQREIQSSGLCRLWSDREKCSPLVCAPKFWIS